MPLLTQYLSTQALEHYLGNPMTPEQAFSFKQVVELDEQEAYPAELCNLLHQWNFNEYYIPDQYGGKLTSFEEMLAIARAIARRDLTVTIAHGVTYLGSSIVWVGGNELQKKRLATRIKQGQKVAFGLTEKDHGSDILASDTQAQKVAKGYVLSGEKWLIGNGTCSDAIAIFARTNPKGGPRGFSWFLVEKDRLESGSYAHLPKIKTHGLRGADISGIRFQNCFVPDEALIGDAGSGLELTLKALQVTRTLHAGAAPSLGQADTALRVTVAFTLSRQLYGQSLWEMPNITNTLANAFLDILICECLSVTVVRSLHTSTDQMSLLSAIVKYFVPTQVESLIKTLSATLGARYYLREEHCWGIFQKIVRDHAIISVFDGSAAVNLNSIVLQLYQLANCRSLSSNNAADTIQHYLEATFNLANPLPQFDYQQLQLYNRGEDCMIQGLIAALPQLLALQPAHGLEEHVLTSIRELTHKLIDQIYAQDRYILELGMHQIAKLSKSSTLFALAKQYCTFHAAAACVMIWIYNRQTLSDFFARGEWLLLCLNRLLKEYHSAFFPISDVKHEQICLERVAEELRRLCKEDKLFSIVEL